MAVIALGRDYVVLRGLTTYQLIRSLKAKLIKMTYHPCPQCTIHIGKPTVLCLRGIDAIQVAFHYSPFTSPLIMDATRILEVVYSRT